VAVAAGKANVESEPERGHAPPGETASGRRSRPGAALLAVLLVAVAVSPIVVAALSLVGDSWFPAGDWASMLYRVSQVGTRETPLVGTYTVKGWAHPGPLLFWLAAPLYHLTGSDPRSLEWTAALVNVGAVAALAAVAWRRGRWPLLVGTMLLVALLLHGFGPERVVDLWNPFLPLLPFLLTVFLVWDAALGRRRALVEAAFPACLAAQCHLAFAVLVGLLAVGLVAWMRWWPRLVGAGPEDTGAARSDELPGPPWSRWFGAARWALGVAVVLWLAPLFDLLFDLHNPVNILRQTGVSAKVGPVEAVSLVGRYVRPDGPWLGGAEPERFLSVQGSGPLPLLVALAVLGLCLAVARRRRMVDVVALASLSLFLVLGAIPVASQIVLPAYSYLTQWLKIVGGLVWFTVGWTGWRVAEPAIRAVPVRRYAAGAVAGVALVAAAGWTWSHATTMETPAPVESALLQRLRSAIDEDLPADGRLRVEIRGDIFGHFRGAIYYLIRDGYDVTTSDGDDGLKWGHSHRWTKGEPVDRVLTIAVSYDGAAEDAYQDCEQAPGSELITGVDDLAADDRAWLEDMQLRRLGDPDSVTEAEIRRADVLTRDTVRIGVFAAPRVCSRQD
jgi:hypothetical protein